MLDLDILPSNLAGRKKLVRKAQISLLISYMVQEVEMIGVDSLPVTDAFRLLTIDELLGGDLFHEEPEIKDRLTERVVGHLTKELDGMVVVSDTFNYDECLDLIKMIPSVS